MDTSLFGLECAAETGRFVQSAANILLGFAALFFGGTAFGFRRCGRINCVVGWWRYGRHIWISFSCSELFLFNCFNCSGLFWSNCFNCSGLFCSNCSNCSNSIDYSNSSYRWWLI